MGMSIHPRRSGSAPIGPNTLHSEMTISTRSQMKNTNPGIRDVGPISDAEVNQFIVVYQNYRLKYRKCPRRSFRHGCRPRQYMARATFNCRRLGITPQRFIGILVWHIRNHCGRQRMPTPQMLGSSEAFRIVSSFLERADNEIEVRRSKQVCGAPLDIDGTIAVSGTANTNEHGADGPL